MASGRLSIANARMYTVSADAGAAWHALLSAIIAASGLPIAVIEHPAPAPLEDLWLRNDQAAVFMCGLPFSRARPAPVLVAAPVPAPADFGGEPRYWSDLVVRADSHAETVAGCPVRRGPRNGRRGAHRFLCVVLARQVPSGSDFAGARGWPHGADAHSATGGLVHRNP